VSQLRRLVWRADPPMTAAELQVSVDEGLPSLRLLYKSQTQGPVYSARLSIAAAAAAAAGANQPRATGGAARRARRSCPANRPLALPARGPPDLRFKAARADLPARRRAPRRRPAPQRKRTEFWDTQPFYGGSKGVRGRGGSAPRRGWEGGPWVRWKGGMPFVMVKGRGPQGQGDRAFLRLQPPTAPRAWPRPPTCNRRAPCCLQQRSGTSLRPRSTRPTPDWPRCC
jgi:hypothetical protein